ncbi:unnamed protein product [Rotaria sp. Silwood2]|nr:unnamed protein product [Rotaria sp. Silwood2]CAF2541086.1 unnamed protein product [Rotaria sp. Silwood2]CAF4363913.1 unnamed protein product [Rotaria sp. Silwood2]CAF4407494.1 unnamed protein product [Rotaria sp. Silwood2]CAF4588949.1 unnamed protein product [Rotaria sp. Silwood2]
MPESMTMIEHANILNKLNYQNSFRDRISSKNENFKKSLSFNVYSSRHLMLPGKKTKIFRANEHILPSIENGYRHKQKRPSYRTSLYHPNKSNPNQIDVSSLTARGTKSELFTTVKDDDRIIDFEHNHAPPPSPSDYQIERLVYEFNRRRQFTPCLITHKDGYTPYRLPALKKSPRRVHSELNYPPTFIKRNLSSSFETFD